MKYDKLVGLADQFMKAAQRVQTPQSDERLIDNIYNSVVSTQASLAKDAEKVKSFVEVLQPLLNAKKNWATLSPQQKISITDPVRREANNLSPYIGDPINRLLTALISRLR